MKVAFKLYSRSKNLFFSLRTFVPIRSNCNSFENLLIIRTEFIEDENLISALNNIIFIFLNLSLDAMTNERW